MPKDVFKAQISTIAPRNGVQVDSLNSFLRCYLHQDGGGEAVSFVSLFENYLVENKLLDWDTLYDSFTHVWSPPLISKTKMRWSLPSSDIQSSFRR